MDTNYIAIIVSAIIAIVLAMGWFGPLFGNLWAEIVGMKSPADLNKEEKKEMQKKMAPAYITNMVLTLVMMWFLFFFVKKSDMSSGLVAAFLAWLGFVVPLMGSQALWSGKSQRLSWAMFLLTTGYQLLCFVIAGALFTVL